ncbi:nitrogen fixation protein FixH [Maritimibacter sp. 55A14]|uniref:FixH family protein n=1 Tax=Maritimibacter sp. 55A14 TaxID=2174844 RepID=UPI000D6037A4|nr:FixH family protein [Maritimibacter sp. 55A14]PWE32264.1 nitrogen fixation protein FixH [Maritimibacter sp. 55A14]
MTDTGKPLTGRKVLAIAVTAFAVIITVNVVMAWNAISTFPGLEVKNSYVASQEFNEKLAAQQALGWTLDTQYADGLLTLGFDGPDGRPAEVQALEVLVGRTTEARDDRWPELSGANGRYSAALDLDYGQWLLHVTARAADGTEFRQRRQIFVSR